MIDTRSAISIDLDLCGNCGGCVPVCAVDAIYLGSVRLEIDDAVCTLCGDCIDFCPIGSLSFA